MWKDHIGRQLTQWMEMEALDHVPSELVEVYRVMAGDLLGSEYGESLVIGDGVGEWNPTWPQALGMIFWYSGRCNDKLSTAVKVFEMALDEEEVPPPLVRLAQPSEHTCAIYSVLRALYWNETGDFVETLRPGGYSLDPLDYQVDILNIRRKSITRNPKHACQIVLFL